MRYFVALQKQNIDKQVESGKSDKNDLSLFLIKRSIRTAGWVFQGECLFLQKEAIYGNRVL